MAEESKLWYLENFNLLKGLDRQDMEYVEKNTTMRNVERGKYIYFPHEPSSAVYFLKKGRIKIGTYSPEGRQIIKAILGKGEIFGELSLTGEGKRTDFAQALDDSLICALPFTEMEKLMERNSSLGLRVTKLIGLRLRRMERRLKDVIFKDARTRVIDLIKEMAETHGRKVGFEVLVDHNLTHQDIANLTATSRQTVTTILNDLREKDLIYLRRKKILIRDIDKLE